MTVFSDSEYVVKSMSQGWALRWRKNGWMRTPEEPAANADLWDRLLALCSVHRVKFHWVRGHAGNRENERCDKLARKAARGGTLMVDAGFQAAGRRKSSDGMPSQPFP